MFGKMLVFGLAFILDFAVILKGSFAINEMQSGRACKGTSSGVSIVGLNHGGNKEIL